jgi:CBS domain-containing protein
MKVREIMTTEVISASPSTPLSDFGRLLTAHRISGVPVLDDGELVGVISEGDILADQTRVRVGRHTPLDWPILTGQRRTQSTHRHAATVGEVMTTPAISVDAGLSVRDAAAIMVGRKVNRLPVLDAGRLVGIVTRSDLVRAYLRADSDIARSVREDVIRGTMWLDPDGLQVSVADGVVRIGGTVDRRSTATILEKLVHLVEGVDGVVSSLTWETDDRYVQPAASADEREPSAAPLIARDRPQPLHR